MSFAAEMKDFISAAQAGQKMVGAKDDRAYKQALTAQAQANTETVNQKNNDEEGQKAELGLKQAGVRSKDAATAYYNERISASRENRAQVKAALAADAANQPKSLTQSLGDAPPPVRAPAAEVPGAVPINDGQPAEMPPAVQPAPVNLAYSGGGAVQKFAGGGAVGAVPADDASDDEGDTPTASAVPADGEDGTSDTTDISSRSRGFSGQAGLDGVKAGLNYGSKALGLHNPAGVMTPGRQRAAKAWATGAHAAPPEDMDKIRNWVDPEGKLGESERNLAAIGAVYQFKMKHDDPEGAAKVAFQMLQYHRQASQRYAVIAAHAAQNGDVDTAVHAAQKAYANVPDDKDVKFAKTDDGRISYTYTDSKTGKVMSQGIESPDKLAAAAMGFAEKGFDESLMAAIQQRPAAREKPAVDPNTQPMKSADKKEALKGVDAAYASQNPEPEADASGDTPPARGKDEALALKGAAFRIATNTGNPRITHDEALSVATKIADPAVLGKSKMENKKVDGGYAVSIDGRKPVFIPDDDMGALMVQRNAKLKASTQKEADAKKPGVVARAVKAAGDFVKPAADYLSSEADAPKRRKQEALRKTFTEPQIP